MTHLIVKGEVKPNTETYRHF